MTISLGTLVSVIVIIGALVGWFVAIKKIGASEMKTAKEIELLDKQVRDFTARLEVLEECGATNEKTITKLANDIEWIKEGIREIKKALNAGE